jgi:hypothetical protein
MKMEATTVNRYGIQAQHHWRQWLPGRYARIQDPETFFTSLGLQAASRIETMMLELAGDDPPAETFQEKMSRIGRARQTAEEIVQAEMIRPDPSTDTPLPESDSPPAAPQSAG